MRLRWRGFVAEVFLVVESISLLAACELLTTRSPPFCPLSPSPLCSFQAGGPTRAPNERFVAASWRRPPWLRFQVSLRPSGCLGVSWHATAHHPLMCFAASRALATQGETQSRGIRPNRDGRRRLLCFNPRDKLSLAARHSGGRARASKRHPG